MMTWRTCVEVVGGVGDGVPSPPIPWVPVRRYKEKCIKTNGATPQGSVMVWFSSKFVSSCTTKTTWDDVETQSNVGRLFLELLFCREDDPLRFSYFFIFKRRFDFCNPVVFFSKSGSYSRISCLFFFHVSTISGWANFRHADVSNINRHFRKTPKNMKQSSNGSLRPIMADSFFVFFLSRGEILSFW
jgi:hypothetical protein